MCRLNTGRVDCFKYFADNRLHSFPYGNKPSVSKINVRQTKGTYFSAQILFNFIWGERLNLETVS